MNLQNDFFVKIHFYFIRFLLAFRKSSYFDTNQSTCFPPTFLFLCCKNLLAG